MKRATLLLVGVVLLGGFQLCLGAASDAKLLITNYGAMASRENYGFIWGNIDNVLYDAGLILSVNGGSCLYHSFAWASCTDSLFIPAADLLHGSIPPNSPYVSEIQICSTAFETNPLIYQPGCCSLLVKQYTVGLWGAAFSDSMIIQSYLIENTDVSTCDSIKIGVWMEWDVGSVGYNLVSGNSYYNASWVYDEPDKRLQFGILRVPTDDKKLDVYSVHDPSWLHPGPHCWRNEWLDSLMGLERFDTSGILPGPADRSLLVNTKYYSLAPGESHLEQYIIFGWDTADVPLDERVFKTWLRNIGYYRGDINTDNRGMERDIHNSITGLAPEGGQINVTDIVFLLNYLFKETASPWPFTDQADINFDGLVTLADLMGLVNYVFKGTNVPVDRQRFLPGDLQQMFSRPSIYENPDWR